MPGTIRPAQMFDHELNALKGWPSPYALDKRAQPDDQETGILAGMCVYLDPTSKKAKRGCVNGYMPLFVFQGQNEFDVNGDVGNIISGYFNTLVATGAYELETTEFVTPDTYQLNDALTVENAGINQGKLKKATNPWTGGTEMIVGIVSVDGNTTNSNGINTIKFWPVYMPYRA